MKTLQKQNLFMILHEGATGQTDLETVRLRSPSTEDLIFILRLLQNPVFSLYRRTCSPTILFLSL